jgi:hypothetical protein
MSSRKWRRGTPARKRSELVTRANTVAVPKSGSRRMSPPTRARSSTNGKVPVDQCFSASRRELSHAATYRISPSLANSLG